MTITIAIVEDNKLFRESLAKLIRSTDGLELVGEYANAEEAMQLIKAKVDIVMIDIVLPGMSGVELIKNIKSVNENIQFLVCSSYDDNEKIFSALESGASGYILKNYNSSEIINAIRELYIGGAPMSRSIARKIIRSFHKLDEKKENLLTDREYEILGFAARGLMYKEIAEELSITHETVKSHLKNIYQKLHVQNKIEAINKFKKFS